MKKIFLMTIVCSLFAACSQDKISVKVQNDSSLDRANEIVEIPWSDVSPIIVKNSDGIQIPHQILFDGNKTPQKLIFPVSVKAGASAEYTITTGQPAKFITQAYGRFVPERKDDFAWENDKIAFRMYGPALLPLDGPSNGIDVWVKRTENLIIDKWYEKDLTGAASYHIDHGEGVDCYKVGPSLGAGAMAPFVNDSLHLGQNYLIQRVLDNGPLRISFELSYPIFSLGENTDVTETKTISLDAGSYFNKIIQNYSNIQTTLPVAAGIILKQTNSQPVSSLTDANPEFTPVLDIQKGFISYTEIGDRARPEHDNGIVYTAVVFPKTLKDAQIVQRHVLAITDYQPEENLIYYTGAGWSKSGFPTEQAWLDYVSEFAAKLRNPLKITIQ
jgi:hypothetical protein